MMGFLTGSIRSPGGGHGNPLQYSCLENPISWTEELGGLQSIGLQSQTQLKRPSAAQCGREYWFSTKDSASLPQSRVAARQWVLCQGIQFSVSPVSKKGHETSSCQLSEVSMLIEGLCPW